MAEKSSSKNAVKPTGKPADKAKKLDKNLKKEVAETEVEVAPKKKSRVFKIILILFVLLLLLGVGFAVGIYLKLFDIQKTVEDLNLQNTPVIGKYFQKPKTNFDPVDLAPQSPVEPSPGNALSGTPSAVPAPVNPLAVPQVPGQPGVTVAPGVTPDPNLAKLAKQRQQEEAKKISKLARLYGTMKAEEAVPIMSQLDNPTIVAILNKMEEEQAAKVLSQFDPARAAQLSQAMLTVATVQ